MTLLEPELFELLRGFYSLVPPHDMNLPVQQTHSTIHTFLLDAILFNPHFRQYPPSTQYQKAFWKWIIDHLEHPTSDEACIFDFEIDPCIYEHYLSLLSPSGLRDQISSQGLLLQEPPSQSYITHFWKPSSTDTNPQPPHEIIDLPQYHTITLFESRTTIEGGTTGLRTWLASFVLSQHLISHPDLVRNKRVLELGSGAGFLGIIIASLQQLCVSNQSSSSLWLTDVNEEVLARCRHNLQMSCNCSSSHPSISYRLLDWSASLDPTSSLQLHTLLQDEINAELILGADIIFDPTLIPALIGVLYLSLQHESNGPSKIALIAVTNRNQDTINRFLDLAQEEKLQVVQLGKVPGRTTFFEVIEGNDVQNDVNIFKITL
ncbi:hypothetical protein L208DRAFT_1420241 [Tricholoma matsutake]|nr:hypothetical protein L208DRAFT_1420241 [Tricholoma matsutake 945]